MASISFLYVTTSTTASANKIARILLKEKLVACANIIPKIRSLYYWKGQLQQGQEVILILKTKSQKVAKARERIEEIHTYNTPCIAELKLSSLNKDYGRWLESHFR